MLNMSHYRREIFNVMRDGLPNKMDKMMLCSTRCCHGVGQVAVTEENKTGSKATEPTERLRK